MYQSDFVFSALAIYKAVQIWLFCNVHAFVSTCTYVWVLPQDFNLLALIYRDCFYMYTIRGGWSCYWIIIERTFLMMSVRIVLLVRKLWSADSAGWTGLKRPCIVWLAQCCACNNVTNLLWYTIVSFNTKGVQYPSCCFNLLNPLFIFIILFIYQVFLYSCTCAYYTYWGEPKLAPHD